MLFVTPKKRAMVVSKQTARKEMGPQEGVTNFLYRGRMVR